VKIVELLENEPLILVEKVHEDISNTYSSKVVTKPAKLFLIELSPEKGLSYRELADLLPLRRK
jgi:hypothetical protein